MAVARARHGACAGLAPDPLRLDGSPFLDRRTLSSRPARPREPAASAPERSLACPHAGDLRRAWRRRRVRGAGGDPAAIEGWFLLGGTIITVFKIAWFWGAGTTSPRFSGETFRDASRTSSGARWRRRCHIS